MEEKVALVTGGGSGIGRATALALAEAGWIVMVAGRRYEELQRTVEQQKAPTTKITAFTADVAEPQQVGALFKQVQQLFGRLDLLFNNAGISGPPVPFEELTSDQWNGVVQVNLTGAFLCAQGAFRLMKTQHPRGGRIINNGSLSAHTPRPNSAPYTATKHAITGLTKSISLDGRPHDIACSQIDIGNAVTEMSERMAKGVLQASGSTAVESRMDVKHVADAVLYIAGLPLEANVQFMTVMATKMPYVGRG